MRVFLISGYGSVRVVSIYCRCLRIWPPPFTPSEHPNIGSNTTFSSIASKFWKLANKCTIQPSDELQSGNRKTVKMRYLSALEDTPHSFMGNPSGLSWLCTTYLFSNQNSEDPSNQMTKLNRLFRVELKMYMERCEPSLITDMYIVYQLP